MENSKNVDDVIKNLLSIIREYGARLKISYSTIGELEVHNKRFKETLKELEEELKGRNLENKYNIRASVFNAISSVQDTQNIWDSNVRKISYKEKFPDICCKCLCPNCNLVGLECAPCLWCYGTEDKRETTVCPCCDNKSEDLEQESEEHGCMEICENYVRVK